MVLPNLRLASNCRYDLDACDIQEKYPDLFQVSLEVEVEPRDKPGREAPPWEGAGMRGLNPKILFSSREEQQDVLSKFGELWRCGRACGAPRRGHPGGLPSVCHGTSLQSTCERAQEAPWRWPWGSLGRSASCLCSRLAFSPCSM